MKKILTVMMATLMIISVFAGCKKDESNVENASESANSSSIDAVYADLGEGIVAKAGDYEITMEDILVYIDLLVPYVQQSTGSDQGWEEIVLSSGYTARDELINAAIDECRYQLAFVDYAKREGLYSDEAAEKFYQDYVEEIGGESVVKEYLSEYGLSETSFKKYVVYIGAYTAVTENACSDEEADKIYNEKYITAKHILIQFEGRDSEEAAYEEAEAIYKKAVSGESFEDLITAYNEDPGQNVETGYTFVEGDMVTEFYEGALALNVGDISKPIKTTFGYHIIKRYENPRKDSENYSNYISAIKSSKANEFLSDEKYQEIIADYPLVIDDGILGDIDLSAYTMVYDENVNYADGSVFNE